MDILFRSSSLEKECTNKRKLQNKHGAKRADLIQRRLEAMANSESLAVLRLLPQLRAHALAGDRAGQLAVDLDHPYRLIFEVANDPIPIDVGGGLDWSQVTAVRILEIIDYHG